MPDYSDLNPAILKPGLTTPDGANLKPSLVTPAYSGGTPTAANELKPSLRNADGSLKAGLVLDDALKPSLLRGGGTVPVPVNLVTNGTFDDSSAWTLGTGWSIAGGTCNREAAEGGTVITQPIALVAGTQYLVEFDVISLSGGPINARFTGGTAVIASTITTAGKYSVLMTALTGNNALMIAASASGIVCSIDNVTVTEA